MQVLPLDEYVFNTEAHPLPIPGTRHEVDLRSSYLRAPADLDLHAQQYSPMVLQDTLDHYRAQLPVLHAGTRGVAV